MRLLRSWKFWAACVAGCLLLALTESTATHTDALRSGRDSEFGRLLIDRAVSDAVWLPVALIVFSAMQRAMATGQRPRQLLGRAIALGVALAPIYATWGAFARTLIQGGGVAAFTDGVRNTASATILWVAFLY